MNWTELCNYPSPGSSTPGDAALCVYVVAEERLQAPFHRVTMPRYWDGVSSRQNYKHIHRIALLEQCPRTSPSIGCSRRRSSRQFLYSPRCSLEFPADA